MLKPNETYLRRKQITIVLEKCCNRRKVYSGKNELEVSKL